MKDIISECCMNIMTTKNQNGLYLENFEKDACGIGLICSGEENPSHQIVESALNILKNLDHRSALGADGKTSDGAGVLMELAHSFFRRQPEFNTQKIVSSEMASDFAVGMLFLGKDKSISLEQKKTEELAFNLGIEIQAWRKVPVNSAVLGAQAQFLEPVIFQFIVERVKAAEGNEESDEVFSRKLYFLRQAIQRKTEFDVISLSNKTIVYKSLSLPSELGDYYLDLKSPDLKVKYAMVHSRFSTNTLPAWKLAQPFSSICHNGEINTVRGNLTWLRAREKNLAHSLRPENPQLIQPLILSGQSDSQYLDDMVRILCESGATLPEALMTLMPEPWSQSSSEELNSFYQFQAPRMEPWDGPAAVCFCDGKWMGARLDRNGLRPCRYQVLKNGTLVLASELGVLDIPNDQIKYQGRLGPGQIIAFDIEKNRIYFNEQIKNKVAQQYPYRQWVAEEQLSFGQIDEMWVGQDVANNFEEGDVAFLRLFEKLHGYGYTREEIEMILIPMIDKSEEPQSSMGNDTPLAILTEKPQVLFNYFRQMFAQVTNPPIDPIREDRVMSLTMFLGKRPALGKFVETGASKPFLLKRDQPILSQNQYQNLFSKSFPLKTEKISILFSKNSNLEKALEDLCDRAEKLASQNQIIVLTDEGVDSNQLVIPSLLAVSSVHHHLIRKNIRTEVSLVISTYEVRDVHQFACLIGYGAEAVYPAAIRELITFLVKDNKLSSNKNSDSLNSSIDFLEKNYIKAVGKGLLKIMSKMGISTLQSYCGSQLFEILGITLEVVQKYFTGSVSRIGGLSLEMIAKEYRLLQRGSFNYFNTMNEALRESKVSSQIPFLSLLPTGGSIHYREGEEAHLWNPRSIAQLQIATRKNSLESFQAFSKEVERNSSHTLRGFFHFNQLRKSIPIENVEPVNFILRRFTTGAMSLGALGSEVHESLAIAMNRIHAKSNSGEGGESAKRFIPDKNGDSKNSAIKQIASARFGVTAHYLANAIELQIKMAQGAKPGEGGQLPGHKVDKMIADLRHSTPGVTLISPPPHHDIYSIEDLSQLIHDLKKSNPLARISVKLVAEAGIGTVAAGVAKAMADKIVVSGDCGGTGASPLSSIKYAGIPWEMGLAETHQTLIRNGLRHRVVLETDGQLKTGKDVVIAALLGAEEFGFSTAPLVVQGCIMMRKCHLNTCPVGIATQDPILRARFSGQPEYVINYFHFVAEEVRQLMSHLGFQSMEEMVGHTEVLDFETTEAQRKENWKLEALDLKSLLEKPACQVQGANLKTKEQEGNEIKLMEKDSLEQEIESICNSFIQNISKSEKNSHQNHRNMEANLKIENSHRSIGALLSYSLVSKYGAQGLPKDTLKLNFDGVAGQSFGAFLANGISFNLLGSANDYVGKGLSGGKLSIRPPVDLKLSPEASLSLIGNTCLYGATSGEVFIAGAAGERFAVRNSGVNAVVEGLGDHGCEYMTGGHVLILGSIGKNFAAGMSGGLAYIYDPKGTAAASINLSSVELIWNLEKEEINFLQAQIHAHYTETQSPLALRLLESWSVQRTYFVKVLPIEYGKILQSRKSAVFLNEVNHV